MSFPQNFFGPTKSDEGFTFKIWAPAANSVDLLLDGAAQEPMRRTADGVFECLSESARPGMTYKYRTAPSIVVPDPASRFQPDGIGGPSQIADDASYVWKNPSWRPRSWNEAVIYELHVGTFSEDGTYKGVEEKLGHLSDLGVTAIELMPIATFAGTHGWGYDGVFPYAPHPKYGTPQDLKRLIDSAHSQGLMVFLDVVYNHFGPAGNRLNEYAKEFFTSKVKTPWGDAIDFGQSAVRKFFSDNALYWLENFRFDGLRFDAVHEISDSSQKHFLYELAEIIRARFPDRHLILENADNQARYLTRDKDGTPKHFTAQWNDDIHHCFHVLLTDETESYYRDFADGALSRLGRCLTEGFAYQGEASSNRDGAPRGESSTHLPPAAFVNFLQNHDQIGNRALGERLPSLTRDNQLSLATTICLLAPGQPMLFMGEEWSSHTPFYYFCDFDGELGNQVREGRRNEFKNFAVFADPEARNRIPDPNAESTFLASRPHWGDFETPEAKGRYAAIKYLLAQRRSHVLPLIQSGYAHSTYVASEDALLSVTWNFRGGVLHLIANFGETGKPCSPPVEFHHIYGASPSSLDAWDSNWYVGMANG